MFFQVVVFTDLTINVAFYPRWINTHIISITSTRVEYGFYGLPRSVCLKSWLKSILCNLLWLNVALERNFILLRLKFEWLTVQYDWNEMDLGHNFFTHDLYDSSLELLDGICLSIFNACSADGRMWTMPPVSKSPCTRSFISSHFLRTRWRDIFFIITKPENWCVRIGQGVKMQ